MKAVAIVILAVLAYTAIVLILARLLAVASWEPDYDVYADERDEERERRLYRPYSQDEDDRQATEHLRR